MENVLKFVLLAVGIIIVAVLVINGLSLLTTGKNMFDLGMGMLTDSTAELSETNFTQYENSTIDGGRVTALIKKYWSADNMICICVSTKDGANIMYDHDGAIIPTIADLKGFPTVDAKKQPFASNAATSIIGCKFGDTSVATYDENTGYGANDLGALGYINRNAPFKGSIQRDQNDNIRVITFVQQ